MSIIVERVEVDFEDLRLECAHCSKDLDDEDALYCLHCTDELKTRVDELEEQIGGLEGDLSDKQDEVDKLEDDVVNLKDELAEANALLKKAKTIDDILGVLDAHDHSDPANRESPEVSA